MQSFTKTVKNNFAEICIALAFWALLILRFGYAFGTGDQAEFVPYALYLADNSLYETDLFIQKLAENPVNERIFFCSLLSFFAENLEIICFLGHLFFTVFLVVGLLKICEIFIRNQFYSYSIIFALLILSAGILPGGATMYANSFLADSAAHAFTAWGFYFVLKNKLLKAAILFIPATLIHPLIGLFVTILSFGGYFFHICLHQKMLQPKSYIIAIALYVFTAGIYLFLLVPDAAKSLRNEAYYKIFFELRYPHHTLPSHFSKTGLFALVLFAISGLIYFYKREKTLFWFLLLQCFGFVIYTVGLEGFHLVEIGLAQWFRSSMWTYFFGLITLAALAEKQIRFTFQPNKIFYAFAVIFFVSTLGILLLNPQLFPLKNPYEIGSFKYEDEAISVSKKIRETGLEGTFVLPFNFNAHKYYSRQSSYADYKTIPRKNANLGEWYRRMNLIYDLDTAHHLYGFEAEQKARNFYNNLPEENLEKLKNEGVNFMLAETEMQSENLQLLFSYGKYSVYKLK